MLTRPPRIEPDHVIRSRLAPLPFDRMNRDAEYNAAPVRTFAPPVSR